MSTLSTLDEKLARLSRRLLLGVAAGGVLGVGLLDYLMGYEISTSLFYLAPVGLAAWYVGGLASGGIAVLSCITWYVSDIAAGHTYSHPIIPIWNALIRLGFFLISGLLLSALHRSLAAQRLLAQTDSLTGCFTRRAFEERLEHDLRIIQRERGPLTLVYIDVDDFKSVNDRYGHHEGDRVLRITGKVLMQQTRRADTVARLGGDEFVVVFPYTDSRHAKEAVSKIARQLRDAFAYDDFKVTYSIGVVTFTQPPGEMEHAMAAAEQRMYEIKRQGKNSIAFSEFRKASDAKIIRVVSKVPVKSS